MELVIQVTWSLKFLSHGSKKPCCDRSKSRKSMWEIFVLVHSHTLTEMIDHLYCLFSTEYSLTLCFSAKEGQITSTKQKSLSAEDVYKSKIRILWISIIGIFRWTVWYGYCFFM